MSRNSVCDYYVWRHNFGRTVAGGDGAMRQSHVPEPTTGVLMFALAVVAFPMRRLTNKRPLAA